MPSMTAAEVDETIARFRAKYPDLTADEEQAIHDYYAGKSPVLFLRNTFSPTRVQELEAEIKRLTAYQNETAKAWTKLTESQEEEIEKLKALVKELADDLESEVEGRYQSVKGHPAMKPKYERDMEPVRRARLIEQVMRERP